jgi:protein-S-isoprenylcysteine O-methyltransferase Ste14
MSDYGYGLWLLVIVNSAIFILFGLTFFHPRSRRDWRAMGAFSGFIVALFTEMYGFPLTVYLLSGWLGSRFPILNLSHGSGHLLNDLIGWQGDPHLSPFHLASYVFIGAGFWLIAAAWTVLWKAIRSNALATTGPYARIRHPQYAGFVLVMFGFLLQWPTLLTVLMFPVLLVVYRRLAIAEEREVRAAFGPQWDAYALCTPRFIPHRRRLAGSGVGHTASRNGVSAEDRASTVSAPTSTGPIRASALSTRAWRDSNEHR